MTNRKKPGVAFWATVVVVVVPLLYVMSFGPACWIESYKESTYITYCHRPVMRIANGDGIVARSLVWYANLGTRRGTAWFTSLHEHLILFRSEPPPAKTIYHGDSST